MSYILVVDDDADIRHILASALRDAGFRVREAANGIEALASIAAELPRLVLLDLSMPGVNGWNVLSTLRDIALSVPVVLVTARPDAAEQAARYLARGYLAKPFDLAEVLDLAESVCGAAS